MTLTRMLRLSSPFIAVAGLLAAAPGAGATTLTTSLAAWQAGVAGAQITATGSTGLFDPLALDLPTTRSVTLGDGYVLQFSNAVQVTQPQNGFPYLLSDGSNPDLLIPVDAAGNQLSTETMSFASSVSGLGFTVVPFSSSEGGPYTISVRLSDGESLSASLPGGSFDTGTTVPAFFGFYGGGVSSLSISTSDPNGLAFGAFVDVPEPASMALLASPAIAFLLARRRVQNQSAPAA